MRGVTVFNNCDVMSCVAYFLIVHLFNGMLCISLLYCLTVASKIVIFFYIF